MPFAQIIQIIMQILAFIAGLFNPTKMSVREVAYVTDFDCGQVEWVVPPAVKDGAFKGTASVHCLFEGKNGGGVSALRSHLVSQLPQDGGMRAGSKGILGGLPSMSYPTSLKMGEGVVAHGVTQIATNGSSILRDVFESKSIEASGNGRYLKSVYAEMIVTQRDSWGTYDIELIEAIEVKKPAFVPSSEFVSKLEEQASESLLERAVSAVQEMAAHL
jgi:hypothetical protein